MKKKLEWNFVKSKFVKNFLRLSSGTLLAQIIAVLTTPILTRIYSSESFGIFGVFIAIVSIFSIVSSGRYEVALVSSQVLKEKFALLQISLLLLLITSFFTSTLLYIVDYFHLFDFGLKINEIYLILLLAFIFSSVINVTKYSYNNFEVYTSISHLLIIQSLATFLISYTLGYFFKLKNGLLIGISSGYLLGIVLTIYRNKVFLRRVILNKNYNNFSLLYKYKDFPFYNATSTLLNKVASNLPIFFISSSFGLEVAGYYAIVNRVALGPLNIFGQALSQINLKQVSKLRKNYKNLKDYFFKISLYLIPIAILPCLIFIPFGEEIFVFIFGIKWLQAGSIISILIPAYAVKFIVSTLSSTFSAIEKNKLGATWRGIYFLGTFIVLSLTKNLSFEFFLISILVSEILLYSLQYFLLILAVNSKRPRLE